LILMATAVALSFIFIRVPAAVSAAQGPDGSVGGLKSKFVDVKGVKARYYDVGQGEPLLMIHGGSTAGSSTANVFSRNIPGLSKRFRVIAVDRLGSGLTGNPADFDFSTPKQVQFIYDFIQTLKLGPVHVVGHSAGGGVAFFLAVQHPEVVKTLFIVAQGGANPPATTGPSKLDLSMCADQSTYQGLKCRVAQLAWGSKTFDDEYWQADEFMATQAKSKEARARLVTQAQGPAAEAARTRQAEMRQKAWDRVKNEGILQMPILMYAGKQDVLDWGKDEPVAMLRGELGLFDILGAKNPKVQMIIVNEGGHFMYREHVEQFNQDVIGFVDFWAHQPAGAQPTTPAIASATARPDGSIGGLTARFVDVKGVKTRYYDVGKGEPMVMIHGGYVAGSSTANVFSRNIPGLSKRFRVLAPDRLGCGLTGNPADKDYGTAAQVEFVYQFIQTMKLGRVHLVGHSAGGAIAFYLAVEHPEVIKTLTVLGAGPQSSSVINGPSRLDLSKCPDQNVYEGLRCRVEALAFTPATFEPEYWAADQLMATLPKSRDARAEIAATEKANPQAPQTAAYRDKLLEQAKNGGLQVPVLLVAGKQDVLDWRKDEPTAMLRGELGFFDTVGAKNAKVKMIVFNEGGHFMYREHPELLNRDLLDFIDFWARQPAAAPKTRSGGLK